jgi:hypothetical protein
MPTNYLKAVFWDYPALCDAKGVQRAIADARARGDQETIRWIMSRFLERGRFKDTATLFPKEEIRERLPGLRISLRARKKWERFSEDIDLCSTRFEDLNRVDVTLKRSFAEELTTIQSSPTDLGTLKHLNRLELFFVRDDEGFSRDV